MTARAASGAPAAVSVAVRAPAKINLSLDVLGRRADGYHDLAGVMQAVALCDRVILTAAPEGAAALEVLSLCSEAVVPAGEANLALRALRALERLLGRPLPARIRLVKAIPAAAGLGGGSSDAAAVLLGLDRLFHLNLPARVLAETAAGLGADVPFFLAGGTCFAEGKGEVLTPLAFPGRWPVVLARPARAVSTAEVFAAFDPAAVRARPDHPGMRRALAEGDFDGVCRRLANALESVTLPRYPEVAALKERFRDLGAPGCLMSGSGPTVFALARDREEAAALAAGVADLAATLTVTEFSPRGAAVVEGEA